MQSVRFVRNPPFSAESHQQLGRRLAALITLNAEKARKALPASSSVLDTYDENGLAELAMTLEIMGKPINAFELTTLARNVDMVMEEELGLTPENSPQWLNVYEGVSRVLSPRHVRT